MRLKKRWVSQYMFFLICLAIATQGTGMVEALPQTEAAQRPSSPVEFITAEELKVEIARGQPLTIIDVRSTAGLNDERKIKGAIHVKLRRLRSRLNFSPLKEAPRDRLAVAYCACPSDESSIRAAQVLLDAGFKRVRVLKGGWALWQKINGQTETAPRGI